jgi:hypothetical protein
MTTAYLIEYTGAQPCPVYVPEAAGYYTCDPWKARRFETREQANRYMDENGYKGNWTAVEHGFDV